MTAKTIKTFIVTV